MGMSLIGSIRYINVSKGDYAALSHIGIIAFSRPFGYVLSFGKAKQRQYGLITPALASRSNRFRWIGLRINKDLAPQLVVIRFGEVLLSTIAENPKLSPCVCLFLLVLIQ